ncbi:hypothetical protein LJC20_05160 [Eubacteriales bacterium OttesenSCG-928-M02]|nr:hypothetical protein [Eubacteriales bacterium OttesenSCG-928-M02]
MILLYMTSHEHVGLLDDLCDARQILVKKMVGEHSLEKTILTDNLNLGVCQHLVIDLQSLKDNDDAIIRAVVAIKGMYDTRIIILAQGYRRGDALLARLFQEGIYNIVTHSRLEEQQSGLAHCLDTGMEYKDALVYRLDPETQQESGRNNRVLVKKEVSHIRQTVSIGLCGVLPRIGTTTHALQITNYLHQCGYRVAYVQEHEGAIATLGTLYEVQEDGPLLRWAGLDLYTECNMSKILPMEYDFIVYDCGVFSDMDIQRFLSFDEKIICAGAKAWEASQLAPVFQAVEGIGDIHFLFSFVEKTEQPNIRRLMGPFANRTQFAQYAPDLLSHAHNSLHHGMLRRWMSEQTTQPTKKKRRWGRR